MIQVVLASNRNYFFGLLATVTSLLESNKANVFCLHIIDGGLTPRQQRILARRTARHNPANRILFLALDNRVFHGFKADYGNSYMTYARILVAALVETERVIYLDTDLLVAADLRPLWEEDLGDCIVAAAPDRDILRVRDDYEFDGDGGDARYFNAGVMVINLREWRRQNVQAELLRMIGAAPQKFRWWDQTAMNVLFQGKVCLVDPAWNTFADSVTFSRADPGRIFHYIGGTKPWNRYLDTPEFRLWRAFFARHALPTRYLFIDRKLAFSYLQFLRYRAFCHSRILRTMGAGLLRLNARLKGRSGSDATAQFETRYATEPAPAATAHATTADRMQDYILARWG